MARGRTLGQLLTALQAEAGMSLLPASGVSTRDHRIQLLNRVQARLYSAWDWDFAMNRWPVRPAVGTRFSPLPSELDFERINEVWIANLSNAVWRVLGYGITNANYNQIAEGTRGEPRRWAPANAPPGNFELWPVPDAAYEVRFYGAAVLPLLVNDGDRAVLDDNLIVLHAASELMKRAKLPDWEDKLREGQQLFLRLRSQTGGNKRRPFVSGGGMTGLIGDAQRPPVRGLDYM